MCRFLRWRMDDQTEKCWSRSTHISIARGPRLHLFLCKAFDLSPRNYILMLPRAHPIGINRNTTLPQNLFGVEAKYSCAELYNPLIPNAKLPLYNARVRYPAKHLSITKCLHAKTEKVHRINFPLPKIYFPRNFREEATRYSWGAATFRSRDCVYRV